MSEKEERKKEREIMPKLSTTTFCLQCLRLVHALCSYQLLNIRWAGDIKSDYSCNTNHARSVQEAFDKLGFQGALNQLEADFICTDELLGYNMWRELLSLKHCEDIQPGSSAVPNHMALIQREFSYNLRDWQPCL